MINKKDALNNLLDLLAAEGPSGREQMVVDGISEKLRSAGCSDDWIRTDNAHHRLGEGYEVGNLIVQLPGTVESAPRIMFSAHMDTVPLCKGAVPVVQGNRVVSSGDTGLGGDDRAGCAAMVTLAQALLKNKLPHPPITLLFPIAEENGLHGSREVCFEDLGSPVMGFNLDGQEPNEIIVGAMSAARWKVNVSGISTHAGLAPQKGISAGLIAAKALARIDEQGYFGRICKDGRTGTSNIGTMHGGEANNQVMDKVVLTGECRSHDPAFLEEIVAAYHEAFAWAAESVVNDAGSVGRAEFVAVSDYRAFRLDESEPCVAIARRAVEAVGLIPRPLVMDAGLDANNFNEKGLPTVTLGAGSHNFHQRDEYVDIEEYLMACQVLLNIALSAGRLDKRDYVC